MRYFFHSATDYEKDGLLAENQRLKATIVDMEVRFSELLKKFVDKGRCYKVIVAEKHNEKKYIILNQ